jgi:two-component system, LytTR family, sensor kinase
MSKKRLTYIHVFIWLFAIFANVPYATITGNMPARQIVSSLIGFLYLMLVFYLFYSILVPRFLDRKKLVAFFACSFLVVLILPFFGYLLLFLARAYFEGSFRAFFRGYSLRMHMSGYYPVLTAAVFGSFFRAIINWFAAMNQRSEADKQRLMAELDLLKSKLNPHFLFNTLNNIDSLIQKNPAEASQALIRLSGMMRYLTYETTSEYVDLGRERDYIMDFIGLNSLRIKSPGDILFQATADMSLPVAPALFVPLVENAFKFVRFGVKKPAIDIRLFSTGKIITFEISNYYKQNSSHNNQQSSGYGIINLQKRLELIYHGRHKLESRQEENLYTVTLTIDTHAN